MRTIEKTVYLYEELPTDKAKSRARDWLRDAGIEPDWWEFAYEDAKAILAALGFYDVDIQFSGFGRQGDGASFSGRYGFSPDWRGRLADYCPLDPEILAVGESLEALQNHYDGRLTAVVSRDMSRLCVHEMTMRASLYDEGGDAEIREADEADFIRLARRLATWIYNQLERAWDCMDSDESVAEAIVANEYEFYADGTRCRK
jgi:hypothetical protein